MRVDAVVAGVILAGGKSRRMGRNKALLPFRGRRLIDHMVELVSKVATADQVYVSGEVAGCRCIADQFPDLGPLAGIYSALLAIKEPVTHLLVVPVDMPLLRPETLVHLIHEGISSPTAHYATAQYKGFELPLLLEKSQVSLDTLSDLCSSVTPAALRSIRELEKRLGGVKLKADNLNEFLNTNTPENWNEIR